MCFKYATIFRNLIQNVRSQERGCNEKEKEIIDS